jgi:hypothetical protein
MSSRRTASSSTSAFHDVKYGQDRDRDVEKSRLEETFDAKAAEDAPPPYNPGENAGLHNSEKTHQLEDDPLEVLRDFNTIIILDDSTSMCGSLWHEVNL